MDAVIIGSPDHWHVPMVLDALKAGKDVYCEKPITHTIAEGDSLIAAVHNSSRIVQIGTQQRSWPHFAEARELVAQGKLGKVTLIGLLVSGLSASQGCEADRSREARLEPVARICSGASFR